MAKILHTEITINASAERVWELFTQFDAYPNWNPFIQRLEGKPQAGEKIRVLLTPPDAKAMEFKPKVLEFIPGKKFRWLGHLLFPGIFDGEHNFELKDLGNGQTLFIQSEKFNGILVPFLKKMLDNNTKRGFEAMNLALKDRVEALS